MGLHSTECAKSGTEPGALHAFGIRRFGGAAGGSPHCPHLIEFRESSSRDHSSSICKERRCR